MARGDRYVPTSGGPTPGGPRPYGPGTGRRIPSVTPVTPRPVAPPVTVGAGGKLLRWGLAIAAVVGLGWAFSPGPKKPLHENLSPADAKRLEDENAAIRTRLGLPPGAAIPPEHRPRGAEIPGVVRTAPGEPPKVGPGPDAERIIQEGERDRGLREDLLKKKGWRSDTPVLEDGTVRVSATRPTQGVPTPSDDNAIG